MITVIKKTLFLSLLFLSLCSVWGQTTIHNPNINLQVALINSTSVRLTWVTPPQAISCEIEYKTHYSTTTYPVPNFSLNSVVIPRANPTGPEEEFTISFTLPNGDTLQDITIYIRTYGGMVVIEDDIFTPISNDCGSSLYQPDDTIYFVDICVIVEAHIVCLFQDNIQNDLINEYGNISPGDPEWDSFVDDFESELQDDLIDAATPPITMSGINTCHNENIPGDGRHASNALKPSPTYSIRPNPFSDRIILKTKAVQGAENQPASITICNLHGKTVYSGIYVSDIHIIPTNTWVPGIYTVSIRQGTNTQAQKMVKY